MPRTRTRNKISTRRFRPLLEPLEGRDAPAVVESFDATPVGALPTGWSQWSSTGANVFAVSSALARSAPNGLACDNSAGPSNLSARTWFATAQSADIQVSSAVYLNTLIPGQVLARGNNLNSATPTFYAASITRGLQLQLVSVVNGVSTTLGQISSPDYISGKWASVTLYVSGNNVRAQVERLDRFQYLNASDSWQTDPAWALNLTDTSISGGGFVGLGRPSSYTGVLTFDDFSTASSTPRRASTRTGLVKYS